MIHVVTGHVGSGRWVDVQAEHLARHTPEPYATYASVARSKRRRARVFDVTLPSDGTMAGDFNRLAALASRGADASDLLVFMHGDAFPIDDWVGPVRRMLRDVPLAAVERPENLGEPIPKEVFCATRVGFWSEIGGDWSMGPVWTGSDGRSVTDEGAVLMETLARRRVAWHRIRRTNARDLHPLWFGVYGGFLYHHGALSRPTMSRIDAASYAHLPALPRRLAGLRRRLANELLSRGLARRIARDDRVIRRELMEPRG